MRALDRPRHAGAPPAGDDHELQQLENEVARSNSGRNGGGLAAVLLVSSRDIGFANSNRSAKSATEGTWFVRVTLRNCDTNASLGSFLSLVTYHQGGRSAKPPPAQPSPSGSAVPVMVPGSAPATTPTNSGWWV
jgi:hypothetical protein